MKLAPTVRKQEYEDELDAQRPFVLARSQGYCEARVPGVCKTWAESIHHRLPRGAGGGNELENLLHCCGDGAMRPGCHTWIESRRRRGERGDPYELGLLLKRGQDPGEHPYEPPRRLA